MDLHQRFLRCIYPPDYPTGDLLLKLGAPVADEEHAGLDHPLVVERSHLLFDLVVEFLYEVVLLLDLEFIGGFLVIDEIGGHLGGYL